MTTEVSWGRLRSDIYIRDKGMCWICNTFVKLEEYDLGHIVDRCNGGHDDYDNLVVMHKPCNLSKPRHETLEEAMKWKLTAFMPAIKEARGMTNYSPPQKIKCSIPIVFTPKPSTLAKRQKEYDGLVAKIKPATVCWIQGRPCGGAMWRVLPPPYRKEDMFSMRLTPLGATDNGKHGVAETLHVLGGALSQDIHMEYGTRTIHIYANNGTPKIEYTPSSKANTGLRKQTIGMGKGQIPIEEWRKAKAQGISLMDFKRNWTANTTAG